MILCSAQQMGHWEDVPTLHMKWNKNTFLLPPHPRITVTSFFHVVSLFCPDVFCEENPYTYVYLLTHSRECFTWILILSCSMMNMADEKAVIQDEWENKTLFDLFLGAMYCNHVFMWSTISFMPFIPTFNQKFEGTYSR